MPGHISSFRLRDALGTGWHFENTGSTDWTRRQEILFKLVALGVRNVRAQALPASKFVQTGPGTGDLLTRWVLIDPERWDFHSWFEEMAAVGVRFTWLAGNPPWKANPPNNLHGDDYNEATGRVEDKIATIAERYSDVTAYIEAPNEYDHSHVNHDMSQVFPWHTALKTHLVRLRDAVNAHPELDGIPILGPSLTKDSSAPLLGDLTALVDVQNLHLYSGNKTFLTDWFSRYGTDRLETVQPGQPIAVTEFGDTTSAHAPSVAWNAITEREQAILLIKQYLTMLEQGAERCFQYRFTDNPYGDNGYADRFGLLRGDLTEKPAYNSLQKLLSLGDQTDTPIQPLDWTLTNAPADTKTLVCSNQDGTHLVLIWREAPLGVQSVTARVEFPGKSHKVSYDLIDLSPDCPFDFPEGYEFAVILADNPVAFRV